MVITPSILHMDQSLDENSSSLAAMLCYEIISTIPLVAGSFAVKAMPWHVGSVPHWHWFYAPSCVMSHTRHIKTGAPPLTAREALVELSPVLLGQWAVGAGQLADKLLEGARETITSSASVDTFDILTFDYQIEVAVKVLKTLVWVLDLLATDMAEAARMNGGVPSNCQSNSSSAAPSTAPTAALDAAASTAVNAEPRTGASAAGTAQPPGHLWTTQRLRLVLGAAGAWKLCCGLLELCVTGEHAVPVEDEEDGDEDFAYPKGLQYPMLTVLIFLDAVIKHISLAFRPLHTTATTSADPAVRTEHMAWLYTLMDSGLMTAVEKLPQSLVCQVQDQYTRTTLGLRQVGKGMAASEATKAIATAAAVLTTAPPTAIAQLKLSSPPSPQQGWELLVAGLPLPARSAVGCWNPACTNVAGPSELLLKTKKCSKCDLARYCSAACQKQARTREGHRGLCCAELAALAGVPGVEVWAAIADSDGGAK